MNARIENTATEKVRACRRAAGAVGALLLALSGTVAGEAGPPAQLRADVDFATLLAPADTVAARLIAEEPAPFSALFRQLSLLRQSARLGGSDAEFHFRNAEEPSEAYAASGFMKYAYAFSTPMKWSTQIAWRYNPAGQSTLFPQTDLIDTLIRATKKWEAVCNVRFYYAGTTSTSPSMSSCEGQNVVGWAPLTGSTVGRTQVCYSGSSLVEADVVFDNEQPYQLTSLASLEMVAAHEFGHVLGLGHTSISPAVMTSTLTTGTPVTDDVNGCVSLYGAPVADAAAPVASLSVTSLAFSSQTVGTTSAAKNVRLTNSGGGTLTVSSLTLGGTNSGDFGRGGTCAVGTALGAGQYCDIGVSFSPLASGTRSAALAVVTDASATASNVALSGSGTDPAIAAPLARYSALSVDFRDQALGTTSRKRTVSLTNGGSAPLLIQSVALGGANPVDFRVSGCAAGTTLAVSGSCTFSMTFTPTAAGLRSADLAVLTNASATADHIALVGNGVVSSGRKKDAVVGDMVEYHDATLDVYFMTAIDSEIDLLDAGTYPAWRRTGEVFTAAVSADGLPPTALAVNSAKQSALVAPGSLYPVCRFRGNPERGIDSHFYSASPAECAHVAARLAGDWILETAAMAYVYLPDTASGSCAADTVPLYRLLDPQRGVHRYATDPLVREEMLDRGWVSEGYGPSGVAMCLPTR